MGRKRQPGNRDRLVEGALELLREAPYSDLTVDRLARSVRMSKSTLYKHFRGKDDLVDAVVARTATAFEQSLASLPVGSSPRARVLQVLEGWQAFGEALPGGVLDELDQLPQAARRRLDSLNRDLDAALASAVTQAATRGELRTPPELTRVALVAAAQAGFRARAHGDLDGELTELIPLFWQDDEGNGSDMAA